QSKQSHTALHADVDVLAIVESAGKYCVHCLFVRDGRVLGSEAYYPKVKTQLDIQTVFSDFIGQRYSASEIVPSDIICNYELDDAQLLSDALSVLHNKRIKLSFNVRGQRAKWVSLCETNAYENLALRLAMRKDARNRLTALQQTLNLDALPQWMECFDISHHAGKETVASCVVFSQAGPDKKRYRQFNISDITPGDDYAAMRQVFTRRYQRLLKDENGLPDIVFVDGGKGQLSAANEVFNELNIQDVLLVSVSKGPTRKAGFELLHFVDGREVQLDMRSKALHLIQHMRDESHRFAVRAHTRAKKASQRSSLEGIAGVGPVRRKKLLQHFGGLQQVKAASIDELTAVDGINQKTAALIHAKLSD
ncbi:MAG: excinuclease ABC subunit UvrC, partial [Pseudomonadota bacterium]